MVAERAASLTPVLVLRALRGVIDPELGVNIVDLGLVYEVGVATDGVVTIEMTLTARGCLLEGCIDDEIRACLAQLPQVRELRVRIVWEPAWGFSAMSDAARERLGLLS